MGETKVQLCGQTKQLWEEKKMREAQVGSQAVPEGVLQVRYKKNSPNSQT